MQYSLELSETQASRVIHITRLWRVIFAFFPDLGKILSSPLLIFVKIKIPSSLLKQTTSPPILIILFNNSGGLIFSRMGREVITIDP